MFAFLFCIAALILAGICVFLYLIPTFRDEHPYSKRVLNSIAIGLVIVGICLQFAAMHFGIKTVEYTSIEITRKEVDVTLRTETPYLYYVEQETGYTGSILPSIALYDEVNVGDIIYIQDNYTRWLGLTAWHTTDYRKECE